MIGVMQWLVQRITGVFLLAGLIIHFYIMHYSGSGQISYEAVMARLSSPYWVAFNILFLLSAVYHGFNGLWGISIEYLSSSGLLRLTQAFIVVSALLLVFAGIYIIMP